MKGRGAECYADAVLPEFVRRLIDVVTLGTQYVSVRK